MEVVKPLLGSQCLLGIVINDVYEGKKKKKKLNMWYKCELGGNIMRITSILTSILAIY